MRNNGVCFFAIVFVITAISGMMIRPVFEVQSPTVAGLNADLGHTSAAKIVVPSVSEAQSFTVAGGDADLSHTSAAKIGALSVSEAQSFTVAGEDADLSHTSAAKIGAPSVSEAQSFTVAGGDAYLGRASAAKIGAPSVSEAQSFTDAGGDADLGHTFAVSKDLGHTSAIQIGAPSVSDAQSFTGHTSANIGPPSVSEGGFRSRRLLSTTSPSKNNCTKCCPADTTKSIISKIVGWIMVIYLVVAIGYFVYAMRKSFQDLRYHLVVKEGDKETIVNLDDDEEMQKYYSRNDYDDIRQATLLDLHIDDMKKTFHELGNCKWNKLRRTAHAAQHTKTVLQAACSPFLMFYIALRICWPALVVIRLAKPWDEELESIHRTVD